MLKSIKLLILFLYSLSLYSQKWDDTNNKKWPDGCLEVSINSSEDNSIQKAIFYKASNSEPRPLIVSLHTWSGNYLQEDPLIQDVILNNFNYIHPDFRGANNKPDAGGSNKVLSDIQDAILYAISNSTVNTDEIHIIGTSGGGYATLLCYTRLNFKIKSYSAWVPISDLNAWYEESLGRNQKYASDILNITNSQNGLLDSIEAIKRSPLFDKIPMDKIYNSNLYIYAGIHDGYTGSVPITHAINMYNRVVSLYPNSNQTDTVSNQTIISLLTKRKGTTNLYGDLNERKIHLKKDFNNVHLILFEGTHEQLDKVALNLVPIDENPIFKHSSILTIGDSNATFEYGWSNRIKYRNPFGITINYAIAGNTIGFDNNGQTSLNTLSNIDSLINTTFKINNNKTLDYIIINLGTNDCKSEFKKKWNSIKDNYLSLINYLKNSKLYTNRQTKIIIVSINPINTNLAPKKYKDSEKCIEKTNLKLKKIAQEKQLFFIDTYSHFLKSNTYLTSDGVHLLPIEHDEMAKLIIQKIEEQ